MTEWTEWTTDAELGAALVDLGAHVSVPQHSLWLRVHARLDERETRRGAWPLWAVAAAVIAVITIAIVSIAPARHAIADLLGIGATQVQHVERLPSTEPSPALPSTGDRAALARQLAQHHLFAPDAALVGEPVAWRVNPNRETVVAYDEVTFSQRALTGATPSIKRYASGANVEFVEVGDEFGVFVGGEHTRTIDGRTFRSANALIWTQGGSELRLEGDLAVSQMLTIAGSVTRAG